MKRNKSNSNQISYQKTSGTHNQLSEAVEICLMLNKAPALARRERASAGEHRQAGANERFFGLTCIRGAR